MNLPTLTAAVDRPKERPSAYAYVLMTNGIPLFIPRELGGTGNWLDYKAGHPPVPITEAAKEADRLKNET